MSRSRFLDVLSVPGGGGGADRNSGMRAERNAGGMTRMQPPSSHLRMGTWLRCVCDPAEVVLRFPGAGGILVLLALMERHLMGLPSAATIPASGEDCMATATPMLWASYAGRRLSCLVLTYTCMHVLSDRAARTNNTAT